MNPLTPDQRIAMLFDSLADARALSNSIIEARGRRIEELEKRVDDQAARIKELEAQLEEIAT